MRKQTLVKTGLAAAVLALLVSGLGMPVASQTEPGPQDPTASLAAYEIVTLDPAAMRLEAMTNGHVDLSFLDPAYLFVVTPVLDMAPGATILNLNPTTGLLEPRPVEIIIFHGVVPGTETTATFMLNGAWVDGTIYDPVRGDTYIEPRSYEPPTNGLVETVIYRTQDRIPLERPADDNENNVVMFVQQYAYAHSHAQTPQSSTTGGTQTTSTSTSAGSRTTSYATVFPSIDIDVDQQYVNTFGGNLWPDKVRSIISRVNDLYYRQLNLMFQPRTLQSNGFLTSWDSSGALDQFRTLYAQRFSGQEWNMANWASYFSGKDFNGPTIGLASDRYTLTQHVGDNWHWYGNCFRPCNDFERAYAAKHELGHNHEGNHDKADRYYQCGAQNSCWWRTVMEYSFWDNFEDRFSSGTRGSYYNNEAPMKNYISQWRK